MLPTPSGEMVLELRPERNVLFSKKWCTFFDPFDNQNNVFGRVSLFLFDPEKTQI